jgi:four helix bundle protein
MNSNEEFKKKLIGRAFNLARRIIALVDKFPKTRSAWIIGGQIIRSATSIGANIIEAQAASSTKDFINFLNHALKSGNETKFWLALSRDIDKSFLKDIGELMIETEELVKILGSSISTLKGKRKA